MADHRSQSQPQLEPDFGTMLEELDRVESSSLAFKHRNPEFAEFPVDEYQRRYARASQLMELEGLDALLLTQDVNVRYFAGYLTILWGSKFRPYVLILPRDPALEPRLVVPWQEGGNAEHTSWVPQVAIYSDQDDPIPHIAAALADAGLEGGRIGTELGFGQRIGMTIEQLTRLRQAVEPAELVNGTPLVQAVRMVKSDREVDRIRRACEISQLAVRTAWEALRPGMTEKDLARILGVRMHEEGAELGVQPSFFAINCGPRRYKMPNALASDYELQRGDLVMVDGGAVYGGYSTDFIRQACVGEPTTDQQKWFEICVEANDACIRAIRPGVVAADVYNAGMEVFEKAGVAEYNQVNIVGHGTGMELHELPWLGERDEVYTSSTPLVQGMVVCIEPAIGPDWNAGCFIVEDKVLVTENGAEVLTTELAKDLWVQR